MLSIGLVGWFLTVRERLTRRMGRKTQSADRVIVTGSNIPTADRRGACAG